MNITSAGVKGYEYQYYATIYIALKVGLEKITSLRIEMTGKEDAYLQIEHGATSINIEIQAKMENNVIDITKLSNWLTHFQEQKVDNNLLHRISTTNDIALFISRSRCDDETVFLKNFIADIEPHKNIHLNKQWNSKFKVAISEYSEKSKRLGDKRKQFCVSQASLFSSCQDTSVLLKKVIIWEEVTEEQLRNEVNSLLNKKYKIAQSRADTIQLSLLELVRRGRDEQIEIKELLQNTINSNKTAAPSLTSNYVIRPEEKALLQQIKSNNILLLTGSSLCGKSVLAKQLAFHLFEDGYNYTIGINLQEISLFFSQNSIEDKIAILEDPWGGIEKSLDSLTIWRNIENFVGNLASKPQE
ncbi:nSTAND3 domain-containing NTPase [Rhizosphaericola mali]|uniref:Novel STAND NTPase 3 domain-containing protein n=1 Tax=Rhizosphaericola mali TaxID=2545455 RepID=A0A5P2FWY5_9BACT|nr:hypothetical protein [Rhizosphaericola mali]QES88034.1 hypothetical protein E0W69_004935 [Rhizosphaericola mali]